MPYRISLVQHIPNRAPSGFQARYGFRNGTSQTWALANVNPDRDTYVVTADCAVDLVNQPDVLTRTLVSHYPTAPNTVETQISSVQRP